MDHWNRPSMSMEPATPPRRTSSTSLNGSMIAAPALYDHFEVMHRSAPIAGTAPVEKVTVIDSPKKMRGTWG